MNNRIGTLLKQKRSYTILAFAALAMNSCVSTKEIRKENTTVPDQFQGQTTDTLNMATMKWKDYFHPILI